MSKTFNLPAALLAVIATALTVVGVHGVAAYEQHLAIASVQAPVTVAAASPVVHQVVVVGRRASV